MQKSTPSNPFVFFSKAAYMQRISDLVRSGHHHFVQGEIPLEKVAGFYSKMNMFYSVDEGRLAASRKRKAGKAAFRLLLARFNSTDPLIHFVLLCTAGDTPDAAKRESWLHVLSNKISITGYELVRHTRKNENEPAWSWRYTKQTEIDLRDSIVSAIKRKSDKDLSYLISQVADTIGFALARDQAKKMFALVKSEWKRHRNITEPLPELPKRIRYVQRVADIGRTLNELTMRPIRKTKLQ